MFLTISVSKNRLYSLASVKTDSFVLSMIALCKLLLHLMWMLMWLFLSIDQSRIVLTTRAFLLIYLSQYSLCKSNIQVIKQLAFTSLKSIIEAPSSNMWNLLKGNNKDTRTASLILGADYIEIFNLDWNFNLGIPSWNFISAK